MENATGNILFDRLSDLKRVLRFSFLKASVARDPNEAAAKNHKNAQLFTEILMRRRHGEIASMPLLEEWLSALILLFLFQRNPKSLRILPYGFVPGTTQFEALIKGCTLPEIKAKFRMLDGMKPRALRSEIGSAARLVNGVFRSPHFLARCDHGFDLGNHINNSGKLIVERGDEIDEDASTTMLGAYNLSIIDYAMSRPRPFPPIRIYLDEATNAKTAGRFEAKAAGETRKYGLSWCVLCQYPNFPGGSEGYFQNFPRKEIFRTADRDLARKMAQIIASEHPEPGESYSSQVETITSEIMNLRTGWRFVTGPGGSRHAQYVTPPESWPDWPGLREAKLREKLECIYSRTEYQKPDEPESESGSNPETPPAPKSRESFSPAERWKRQRKKPVDGSAKSENESESESEESSN